MPKYKYEAYDANGSTINGTVVASDKEAALRDLEQSGVMVNKMRPVLSGSIGSRAVKNRVFYQFNQEMIALTRAGIPLVEALGMCIPRPEDENFSDVLTGVRKKVSEGKSFSEACQDFPEVFDSIYVAAMQTSEQTGSIKDSLIHYQAYLERKVRMEKEIKQALYYPVFLLVTLGIVLMVLFIYVVPKFSELYDGFGNELPMATQVVIKIANAAPIGGMLLILLVITIGITWKLIDKPKSFLLSLDKLLLSAPIFGNTRAMLQQSRLMTMVSGLLSAGTPLVSALKISAQSMVGLQIGLAIEFVIRDVEDGGRFSDSLKKQRIFSDQVVKMLDTGENAGALEHMMKEVALYSEEILDEKLKRITALFEPALMSLIGVLVGAVIIAMYLPIFFLAEVVQ